MYHAVTRVHSILISYDSIIELSKFSQGNNQKFQICDAHVENG